MASAQIFLSAVSAEFRSYRDALRRDLDRPNVTVKVQEDFIATGTETLDKLDAYIQQCDAVIHLVGDMTGALAQPPSVAMLRERYADLAERLPVLGHFLQPDAPALSYTQWEAWLALYHRKLLIIAVPLDGAPRDERYTLDANQRDAQQKHIARLARVERYPEIRFANADRLAVDVLRSALQDILVSAASGAPGKPFQAPPLSDKYVERRCRLLRLKVRAMPSRRDASRSVTRIVLHGPGGAGKTVLASALAHDPNIQSVFPDGVLWASLGEGGDLMHRLSDWGQALTNSTVGTIGYSDERTAVAQLRTLLNDRACLLVVDDARDARAVKEAFLVGGRRCLLVVTTRWREVATAIGATEVFVGEMVPKEAMALLEGWTGAIQVADRDVANSLAGELGYLPLALELMGAQVHSLGSWTAYRQSWDTQRLDSLKRGRLTQGKEDNLVDCFEVSVRALPAADRDKYLQLAVFPQEEYFPASAAAVLWNCPKNEASELLLDLADQALLSRRSKHGFDFTLANLFHEFVTSRLGKEGLARAHSAIVNGYRKLSPHGWPSGPNERYYFEHLSRHLAACGDAAEVHTLITATWMKASSVHTGTQRAFLADVARSMDLAAQQRPPGLEQLVRGALVHSTIATLASQMPTAALAVLTRAGHGEQALAFAGVMQDSGAGHVAYVAIAEALLDRGEPGDAVLALERALDVVGRAGDRSAALADIARLASRAKSATLLERILGHVMQDSGARHVAYVAIAEALLDRGEPGDAVLALERALDVVGRAGDRSAALADIARLASRAKSTTLLERILAHVGQSDAAASSAIALALSREGDQPRALEAAHLSAAHARALGDEISTSERLEVLGAAIRALHAASDQEEAAHLSADAQAFAGHIGDDRARAGALVQLARTLADTGDAGLATELATRAMGIVCHVIQCAGTIPAIERLRQAVYGDNGLDLQQSVIYAAAEVIKAVEDDPEDVAMARSRCGVLIHVERAVEMAWAFELRSKILQVLDHAGEVAAAHAVTADLLNALAVMPRELREDALQQFVKGLKNLQTEVVVSDAASKVLRLVEQTADTRQRMRDLPELISALGRSGDNPGFEQALDLAYEAGSELNGSALGSAVAVYCAKLNFERALDLRASIEDDDEERGIATAIIARGVAQQGDGARARLMAGEITDPVERSGALADIAVALAENGKMEDAVEAANNAIATAQSERTWWREFTTSGLEVLESVGAEQDKSTALMAIARTLASVKEVERARAVANKLTDPIERSIALSQIAIEIASAGDTPGAAAVARQALTIATESSEGNEEDSASDTLDQMAEAAPATDVPPEDEILRTLTALTDPQGRARISSWIGFVLSQSTAEGAAAFAWRAVRAAQAIPDRTRQAEVILDLVRVCARVDDEALERDVLALAEALDNSWAARKLADERVEAERLRKKAKEDQFSVIGREAQRAEALGWAANALGQAGAHDQVAGVARAALEIATQRGLEENRVQVMLQIAEAFGATNDIEALKQLETSVSTLLSEPESKILVACQIAYAWARLDSGKELTRRIDEVLSALRANSDEGLQAAVLRFIGEAWGRAGNIPKAKECVRRAVSVAKSISDEERQVAVLSEIADSAAIVGDVSLANEAGDAAADTAGRIHGASERALALVAAGSALAQAGQDEPALGMLICALSSSRRAQRNCIFQVIEKAAEILGKLGLTEGLWVLFQGVQEDDTWWPPV